MGEKSYEVQLQTEVETEVETPELGAKPNSCLHLSNQSRKKWQAGSDTMFLYFLVQHGCGTGAPERSDSAIDKFASSFRV